MGFHFVYDIGETVSFYNNISSINIKLLLGVRYFLEMIYKIHR